METQQQTETVRAELLAVMPEENIQEYMANYGFTWEEVVAELDRRNADRLEWFETENAKLEAEMAAVRMNPNVMLHFNADKAKLDEHLAQGLLSKLDYMNEMFWTMGAALNANDERL